MDTKKRVFAYYDGSNFYHHGISNYGIKDINFFHMTNQLLDLQKQEIVKIKYFNSPISQQEDPISYIKQQKFFENIKKTPLTELFLGDLVKRTLKKINVNCPICSHQRADCLKCPKCNRDININNCFKYVEKGVDVKLAITMILDALENKFDIAMLFSSDADYTPAIKYIIKNLKKDVVYCHFPYPKTNQLYQSCSRSILITKEMMEKAQITNY